MNVFLTPELKPFVGGTYFPLRDSLGRPGFATLVKSIVKEVRSNCCGNISVVSLLSIVKDIHCDPLASFSIN